MIGKMTSSLHRFVSHSRRGHRSAFVQLSRTFSSESLVEYKPGEIGTVSGIPDEHLVRKVVIYSPARTATQQGSGKLGRWKINFMSTQKCENPLMGWTSTGDPYAHVGDSALGFDSEEAAKAFAERHGWDYVNYSSVITVHPEVIDGRVGTLVIESFLVDVPDGNTKEETYYFVKALINCNLKSLAEVSERMDMQDRP